MVDRAEFVYALNTAKVFASKDSMTPVLQAIRFRVADGHLHVEATDRFKAVEVRMTIEADGASGAPVDGAAGLLPLAQVAPVLAEVKAKPKSDSAILIGVADGAVTVERLRGQPVEGEFPNVSRLYPGEATTEGAMFALSESNVKALAVMAKKRDRHDQDGVRVHPAAPGEGLVLATKGNDVRAIFSSLRNGLETDYVW